MDRISFPGLRLNREYKVLETNKAAHKFFGMNDSDLIGKTCDELLRHPLSERLVGISKLSSLDIGPLELTLGFKTFFAFPVGRSDDFIDLFFIDINELRLGEVETYGYAAVIEATGESVILTDARGLIIFASPALQEATGYSNQELMGKTPKTLKSGIHDQAFYESFWDHLNKGKTWQSDIIDRRKDGTLFRAEIIATPFKNHAGKVMGFASVHRNITHFSNSAGDFGRIPLRNNSFSSIGLDTWVHKKADRGATGEMRNNIASLSNSPRREQEPAVSLFDHVGQALLNIVNDLLDLSKIEAGQIELERKPFLLNEILGITGSLLDLNAKKRGLKFITEILTEENLIVVGDELRLRQILLNLLRNAMSLGYRSSITFVVKETSRTQDHTTLLFSITETNIECCRSHNYLFQNAENLQLPLQEQCAPHDGLSIGLVIAKKLIERMGGSITVEDNADENCLFAFSIQLPFLDVSMNHTVEIPNQKYEKKEQMSISSNSLRKQVGKPQLRILVVDDLVDNQNLVAAFLRNLPITIDFASNGSEALGMIRNTAYDLIFLDIQMPLMNGWETLKEIRQWQFARQQSKVPIISLTALTFEDDVSTDRYMDFDAHLAKPFRKKDLIAMIERYYRFPP